MSSDTIAMINLTRPGPGRVEDTQLQAALPALRLHAHWVGKTDAARYKVVIARSVDEALANGWIPHMIANHAADTGIARVDGAGGFHWGFYNRNDEFYGEPFAVSYTSYDDGRTGVPWDQVTVTITHENAELASNAPISGWHELFLPSGERVERWDENADPCQRDTFWLRHTKLRRKTFQEKVDGAIRVTDFVLPNYADSWDTGNEIRTFIRKRRPKWYSDGVVLSDARRRSTPANWVYPGGYMLQRRQTGNVEYVFNAHNVKDGRGSEFVPGQIAYPYSNELMMLAPMKMRMPGSRVAQCLDMAGIDCSPWMIGVH